MATASWTRRHPSRWDLVCEGIVEASWLVALLATPVFFIAFSDRPFDPCKSALVRSLAVVAGAAWLTKAVTGGRLWRPTDASSGDSGVVRILLAAVAFLAGSLVVSTALSPAPWLSWYGGYHRSLGASLHLSVMLLFVLAVGHLRTRRQLQRLLGVVWWASVPVCLCTLLQSLGLDPNLGAAASARPVATFGNPIFLGAYLGFAFFLGLALLQMVLSRETQGVWQGLRQGILIAVSGLQLWAMGVAASRGPILGVLAGLVLLALLWLAGRGWRRSPAANSPVWNSYLVMAVLVAVAAAAIPAFRAAAPESQSSRESKARRVTELVSIESPTARVRMLLWRGALKAFQTSAPLRSAEGRDRLHRWRRWVGYGPEAATLALAQHQLPELNQLELDRVPDQAHNQLLQTLVAGGLVGLSSLIFLYLSILSVGAAALGTVTGRSGLGSLWVLVAFGAAGGATVPWLGWGAPELAAVGGVGGALAAYLLWLSCTHHRTTVRLDDVPGRPLTAALLLAALVAHGVEAQFGIEVTTVMVYSWLTVAVLAVLSDGWLQSLRPDRNTLSPWPGIAIPAAVFPVILALVFGASQPMTAEPAGPAAQRVVGWLVVASAAVGLALCRRRRELQAAVAGAVAGILGLPLVSWSQSTLVQRAIEAAGPDERHLALARHQTLMVELLLAMILAATVAWGWRLGWVGRATAVARDRRQAGNLGRVAAGVVGMLLVVVVGFGEAQRIEKLILIKGARSAARGQRFEPALDLLDRAHSLSPRSAHVALLQGQTAYNQALIAPGPEARAVARERARTALDRALRLAPYDADHLANLGRWHLGTIDHEQDPERRRNAYDEAVGLFDEALTMRPSAMAWRREVAALHQRMGNLEAAIAQLQAAQHNRPQDKDLLLDLAAAHREQGLQLIAAGAAAAGRDSLDVALELAVRALEMEPENRRAQRAVQDLDDLQGPAGG